MKKFEDIRRKYGYLWVVPAYFILYMLWFVYLEGRHTPSYHIVHTALDDMIPFIEFFVIPYFLWFVFVPFSVFLMIRAGRDEFNKVFTFLSIGMTVFLLISTFYPNGALLRPSVFPRKNFCTYLVMGLYSTDTATNLFPSIHVYNSLGAAFAIMNCDKYREAKKLRIGSVILCILIILSTVFLKQHSVFDVATGIALAALMYILVYKLDFSILPSDNPESPRRKLLGGRRVA